MSTGLLSGLLSAQPDAPAGSGMRVVMIDRKNIIINPDNRKIYHIGDVSRLKEDIKTNGIRQPLEVVELDGGNYKLIGGERRLTACEELAKEGDTRFEALPCVILKLKYDDDEKTALITANATARDLTDGERLAQYEALKDALTKKKLAGQLEGKVRDEICRILGLSTGAAARLNVIASCENGLIKERLKAGEIGLMEAYRSAQDYARFMGAAPEEPEQKEEPAETVPVNPDHAEQKSPLDAIAMLVKKAHEEKRKVQTDALQPVVSKSAPLPSVYNGQRCDYSASHRCENEAGLKHFIKRGEIHGCAGCCKICLNKDTCTYSCAYASKGKETQEQPKEQSHGRDTLHKLAEKTLGANAAWELHWEDAIFRLAYYKQPLPGGATLWKRIDTTREDAGQTCDDYAIILQDNSFATCGWISFYSGITDILTKYFELK